MKSIGSALAAALALSCATGSGERQTEQKPASSPAAQAPQAAQPAPAAPQAAKGAAAPMTAAEAAEQAHQEWVRNRGQREASRPRGDTRKMLPRAAATASAAEDSPCAKDDDCALTRVPPGTCCASLCSPRAVTRARAADLDQRSVDCQHCIEPLCRDPRPVQAACSAGRCVAQPVGSPD
jgi:peptidyl-tRNA hydrolase